jgi:23S rRNA pseudouridine2605 synthase
MIEAAGTCGTSRNLLVKFIAHSGLCSRRRAEGLIKIGEITVNNFVITNPGYEMQEKDVVRYKKKVISAVQPELMYLVMNKPANTLCTTSDPEGRPTIFDLLTHPKIKNTRLYNVGRLDRNTTGAIIVTNDGDLAQRMMHPSFEVRKTYAVSLNRPMSEEAIQTIKRGIKLEDGFVKVDSIEPVKARITQTMIVSLHSGKNRIIRRLFEQIGYFVERLERVAFGPINKKGLAQGEYRLLTKREVADLLRAVEEKAKK